MKTAIDTNIISALWSGEPTAQIVSQTLNEARFKGGLTICGPVYAELLAHPKAKASFVDEFLAAGRIAVDCDLDAVIWREAGLAFASYARRRRLEGMGEPRRLPVDYVVGSHAMLRADRLLTLDRTRYVQDFPGLQIAVP
jgi:predicted nucleic acid-binding protein